MVTDSERKLADWAINAGLPLEAYFEGTDEERRALVEKLARDHYLKGKTEGYINTVSKLWRDIQPILQNEAEEKAVEPKLRRLEETVPKIENRRMLLEADENLVRLPYSKLTGDRTDRYDKLEAQLNDLAKIINVIELETTTLASTPFANREESRELASRVPVAQARELGFTRSGGVEVGTSKVQYRHGVAAKQFEIIEYPAGKIDTRTGVYTSAFRVYDDEGKLLGAFDHKPNAKEIREKWRS